MTSRPMKPQQEIERGYFEQFRRASDLDAIPSYGDKPDVILHLDRKIGVEITNFYLRPGHDGASEQRQRVRREDVITQARNRYRDDGGRGFELTIQFNPKRPIGSKRSAALIAELADLAKRIEDHPTGPVSPVLFERSPELLTVWLNAQEYLDATWRVVQVYPLDFVSTLALSRIIRDKEAKAKRYLPCDAYWLLIVVDWADPAQDQEIAVGELALSSSVFERIILYKPGFNEIIEVKPLPDDS